MTFILSLAKSTAPCIKMSECAAYELSDSKASHHSEEQEEHYVTVKDTTVEAEEAEEAVYENYTCDNGKCH